MMILIDMDEVLAAFTQKVAETLWRETSYRIDFEEIKGKFLSKALPEELVARVSEYPTRPGFFSDLEVLPGAAQALGCLQKKHHLVVVSAALRHPICLYDKVLWLERHFPFLSREQIVFTDNKSLVKGDILIDDHPKHLERFEGRRLLFSAWHNAHEQRFERLDGWASAEAILLS
ncbi:MAG: 5'(3')-deoxyribonucleotidase [Cytophagales bacterium]|nr:5'(3')-deoxyribonucleotidase [Cytophagales bacterium]